VLGRNDIGHRVVVRRIIDIRDNRPVYTDALGELRALSETHITVRTRDGEVRIPLTAVVAAKRIPDRRARSATERLELVAARGWPALSTGYVGEWLLRASDGWSSRGNSALALGDPGRPVGAAVDEVVAWYRARDLPPAITVPLPLGRRVIPELDRRGWSSSPPTLVQTAPVAPLVAASPDIDLSATAPEAWLAVVGASKGGLSAGARHVLTAVPEVRFASGYDESGAIIATGRGVLTEDWLGLSVTWVDPEHRRRGLARRVTTALAAWALDQGAVMAYLQVEEPNQAAVGLYSQLGFRTAHAYVTRRAPG
jgi:GNAT superfamily N-acetyltransferase